MPQPQKSNGGNLFAEIAQIKAALSGKDPQAVVKGLVQSGQLSPDRLDGLIAEAKKLMGSK